MPQYWGYCSYSREGEKGQSNRARELTKGTRRGRVANKLMSSTRFFNFRLDQGLNAIARKNVLQVKKLNASVMAVAVVLASIAFIAPSSAVCIGTHEITFDSHTFDGTYSTWTYIVTSGTKPALSHWVLA